MNEKNSVNKQTRCMIEVSEISIGNTKAMRGIAYDLQQYPSGEVCTCVKTNIFVKIFVKIFSVHPMPIELEMS